MHRIVCAACVALLGTGCAISDLQRVNRRLKDENTRLLMENRELKAETQLAKKRAEDYRIELNQVRQQLAMYEAGGRPTPSVTPPPVERTGAFDAIPDVDVTEGPTSTRVILSEKVFFQPGSCQINSKGQGILKQVATVLNDTYSGRDIKVVGHTDSTPIKRVKDRYPTNWELSTARACAVVRFLEEAGVSSKSLEAAGFAYHRPVASNASEAGKAKNRRVEIVIPRQ